MGEHHDQMKAVLRHISQAKLEMWRNMAFGAAGVSLASLLLITQIGQADVPLKIAVLSSAISLPIWVALAAIYENYIFTGKRGYSHLRSRGVIWLISLMTNVAGFGMFVAVGGVVAHLSDVAGMAYVAAAIVCAAVQRTHGERLLRSVREQADSDKPSAE